MRIAIGGFGAESNALSVESPVTETEDLVFGKGLISKNFGKKTVIGGFLDVLARAEVEIIPTLKVWWGATGIIARDTYEEFKAKSLACRSNDHAIQY